MTDRELMQQALEALELLCVKCRSNEWGPDTPRKEILNWMHDHASKAHTALRERLAQPEREKVAAWVINRGYATGHGDTVEDLLKELEWQVRESEREACAKVCEDIYNDPKVNNGYDAYYTRPYIECADAIRARGNKPCN